MVETPSAAPLGASLAWTIAAVAALLCCVALLVGQAAGIDPDSMLKDAASTHGFHALTGSLSVAGVVVLGATGAILFFALSLGARPPALLASVAAFGWVIALDDQFLLHERTFPRKLGLPEEATIAIYGVLALGLLWQAARSLPRGSLAGLVPALVLLGVSVAVDAVPVELPNVYEDVPKVVGYVCWGAFWIAVARQDLLAPR